MTLANGWKILPLHLDAASSVLSNYITGDTTMTNNTTTPNDTLRPSLDPNIMLVALPTDEHLLHLSTARRDTLCAPTIGSTTTVEQGRARLTLTIDVEVAEMLQLTGFLADNYGPDVKVRQTAMLLHRAAMLFEGVRAMTMSTQGEVMAVLHSVAINPHHVQPAPEPEATPEPELTRYAVRVEAAIAVQRTVVQRASAPVARTFVVLARDEASADKLADKRMVDIMREEVYLLLDSVDESDIDWDNEGMDQEVGIEMVESPYVARRLTVAPTADETEEITAERMTTLKDREGCEVLVQRVSTENFAEREDDDEIAEAIVAQYEQQD
jgi:hypothetical protein